MSFKRDGDDTALLHNLKMRRVGELLGDNIPDDEATLLSNGRLTCLICSHRPIFDTFAVLASHRKGKKHINELGKYLSHKRMLQYRQLKEKQKNSLLSEKGKTCQSKDVSSPSFPKNKISSAVLPNKGTDESAQKLPDLISPTAEVRHYLKGIQRKRALQKTVERCRETYSVPSAKQVQSEASQTPISQTAVAASQQNSETAKRHVELKMSGWLQTADGKWEKDPNAEFDSDEESPDES